MTESNEKGTILIVDDTPIALSASVDHLQAYGFKVLIVGDGASAIEQAVRFAPDMILLDVLLPDIDGFEVCRRLKENKVVKDIPVIFISAISEIVDKLRAFDLGAVDYITRPFYPTELLARIKVHLTICNLTKELEAEKLLLEQESRRRKWVLEALQESRERYRFLTENSTDVIAQLTLGGLYRYVSPVCRALLGYEIEEMIGRPAVNFVHPDDQDVFRRAYAELDQQPAIFTTTYRALRKDGHIIWLETTNRLIRDLETGELQEVVTVSRNITDRKKAEAALQKVRDELEVRVQERTAELAKLITAYGRFVPYEILQFLDKESIVDVGLGDQAQYKMTIFVADIRSFTTLSESMTPQENFNFLNAYLGRVSPIIREHNGFIDKYIGDEVLAIFPESPEDAVQAAIAIREEIIHHNKRLDEEGYPALEIGIGIHTGNVMLGTIGEEKRMDGTVISDVVNLASRIEGLNKLYGAGIIISEQSLFSLDRPAAYQFRFLDRVQVKGKNDPVSVFEIFDGDPAELVALKLRTRTDFEKGLLHYHSEEFAEAQTFFKAVLEQNSDDKAASLYLKRATDFLTYGVPTDWGGIEALTEK